MERVKEEEVKRTKVEVNISVCKDVDPSSLYQTAEEI